MKLLLGTFLLAGVCWLGASGVPPSMLNFDSQRIAGAWYPLLSIPTGLVKSVNFPPFRFVPQPDGNLKYSIRVPQNGVCTTHEVIMNRQGNTGDFASSIPTKVRFVETDYKTYFIAYIMRSHDDTFLALSGSQPTLTAGMEEKLRAFARRHRIDGEVLRSVLDATC